MTMRLSKETESGIVFGAAQVLGAISLLQPMASVTSFLYSAFVLTLGATAVVLGFVVRKPWKWTLGAVILSSYLVAALLFGDAPRIAMCWAHAAATFLGIVSGSVLNRALSSRSPAAIGVALIAGVVGAGSLAPGFSLAASGQEYFATASASWRVQSRAAAASLADGGEGAEFRSWKSTSDLMNDLHDAPLGSIHAVRKTWSSFEAFQEERRKAMDCVKETGDQAGCFKKAYDASPETRRSARVDALDATFGPLLEAVIGERIRERRVS